MIIKIIWPSKANIVSYMCVGILTVLGSIVRCVIWHMKKISFFLCVLFRVLTTYNRVFGNGYEFCSDTPRKLGTLRALHEPLPNPSAILYHLA